MQNKVMETIKWHVYVGAEVGLLKGINLDKCIFSNLNPYSGLNKDDEITAMCWEDSADTKVHVARRNQTVQVFDCEKQIFSPSRHVKVGEGPIKGLGLCNGNIVTAVESGVVKLWSEKDECVEINTGGNICKMAFSSLKSTLVATGGEENDLKIWDLQNPLLPAFKAKNVRNDFLDLRVPVWIMDIKFRPDDKILTCTRHHQIRLYDPKAQKRPVIDMEFERYPLMSLSLTHNEHQVVVGSSRGRMALIDLRKKLLVHVFKGFAGSIRCVQCHPSLPLVASCGLDRFLRIHDLNKHKLLKKIYLKTRLNCLLMKTAIEGLKENEPCEKIAKMEVDNADKEEETIWENMAVITEGCKKKKLYSNENTLTNSVKKQKN